MANNDWMGNFGNIFSLAVNKTSKEATMIFFEKCNHCEAIEERVFVDSWTGTQLCLYCVGKVCDYVTNSPASEGDNLREELSKL